MAPLMMEMARRGYALPSHRNGAARRSHRRSDRGVWSPGADTRLRTESTNIATLGQAVLWSSRDTPRLLSSPESITGEDFPRRAQRDLPHSRRYPDHTLLASLCQALRDPRCSRGIGPQELSPFRSLPGGTDPAGGHAVQRHPFRPLGLGNGKSLPDGLRGQIDQCPRQYRRGHDPLRPCPLQRERTGRASLTSSSRSTVWKPSIRQPA